MKDVDLDALVTKMRNHTLAPATMKEAADVIEWLRAELRRCRKRKRNE
jgi:hypothetical protein